MTKLEKSLNDIIFSGPLQELKFYNVNELFFELKEYGYWIIDAGIQLKFPNGYLSAAWKSENECFVIDSKKIKELYTQDNLIQIETESIKELNRLIGLKVVHSKFKSLEFEYIVDYTMRTEKTNQFVELILEFQNEVNLQLAFIDYDLEEKKAPSNFLYELTNGLLVSVKNIIEIKT